MLRNAVINGEKTEFLRALANWVELTPQTAFVLTITLPTHTVFIDDLLRLISI